MFRVGVLGPAVPDLSPGPSPSPPPSGNNTDPSPPPPPPPPTNPATPFQPEEVYRCATADDCAGSNCPYELCRCSNVGFCIADIPDRKRRTPPLLDGNCTCETLRGEPTRLAGLLCLLASSLTLETQQPAVDSRHGQSC
eukprot:18929-Rhodomonas_salina.1